MKTIILSILIILLLAVFGFAVWLGGRWYGVIDTIQGVTIFYSKSEMFVFIGHSKAVLADSRFKIIGKQLTSGLLIPNHVSDDMMAAHFKNGKTSTFDLKGIGYSGSAFVYRGDFYCYWGGELARNSTWKWNGSNFTMLSSNEVTALDHQIDQKFKYVSESTRAEGWNEKYFQAGWKEPGAIIPLESGEVKVYADIHPMSHKRNDRARIMLVQSGNTNSPEMVIDVVEGYQGISKEEYLELKAQKNVQPN
jgi:hypothetical protein